MIKKFIDYYRKDKDKLEQYFKTHEQEEYDSYEKLLKLTFDIVINPNLKAEYGEDGQYDTKKMHVIDDGDYQGILVFLIFRAIYTPWIRDYIYTHVGYGTCCMCDTLIGIYSDGLPDDKQVKEYMTLCLHMLENCHYMKEREV